MKTLFIFALTFFVFAAACATLRDTAVDDPIELEKAEYHNWSSASPGGMDGKERGTDITLTFSDWPEGYTPGYVIFQKKESFPAEIEKTDENRTVVTARIVHESSVLAEVSEAVFLTDRFVFNRPDGETGYIEIEEWVRKSD
jgi:hypothetical protein